MSTTTSPASAAAPDQPPYSCSPPAKLLYIRDLKQADRYLKGLVVGPLGFDMEWRPNFVKGGRENPVALVQLATQEKVYLIQISAMKELPMTLIHILENPDIAKIGVGIRADVVKLHTDFAVSTRGCVDLSLLARSVDNARWKGRYANDIGLARLVETYTKRSLPKPHKIRLSNWQASLSLQQQRYAANDAHASLATYDRLWPLLSTTDPIPDESYYSFDCVRGSLCHPSGALWHPINPHYDPGPPPPPRPPKKTDLKPPETGTDSNQAEPIEGAQSAAQVEDVSTRLRVDEP